MQHFIFPHRQIRRNDTRFMTVYSSLQIKQHSPTLFPVLKPTVSENIASRQNSKWMIILQLITDEQDLRVQLYFRFDCQSRLLMKYWH